MSNKVQKLLNFLYEEDSYGMRRFREYYEEKSNGWNYQKTSKRAKYIGCFAFGLSAALMIGFHASPFLFWIPFLSYFLGAMFAESFGVRLLAELSNKRYLKREKAEEERAKLEETLRNIPPEKLNTEYALTLIERWEAVETPAFMKNEFKAICKDLRELVDVAKENGINIDKWTQLFRNYMPDIIDVIDDFEGDDGVNDAQMMGLCDALHNYLAHEIEDVKNGRRISNFATVKAYTDLFRGSVSSFSEQKKKDEDSNQTGTPLGG